MQNLTSTGFLTCVALQALLLLVCSEGMGVQRDQDVICIDIYRYRYTHWLYNLHARLYIALYQSHPAAVCKTSLDLITCKRIFTASNDKYIMKRKSLAMAQAVIRNANEEMLGDDSSLPSLCTPKLSWLQVEISLGHQSEDGCVATWILFR